MGQPAPASAAHLTCTSFSKVCSKSFISDAPQHGLELCYTSFPTTSHPNTRKMYIRRQGSASTFITQTSTFFFNTPSFLHTAIMRFTVLIVALFATFAAGSSIQARCFPDSCVCNEDGCSAGPPCCAVSAQTLYLHAHPTSRHLAPRLKLSCPADWSAEWKLPVLKNSLFDGVGWTSCNHSSIVSSGGPRVSILHLEQTSRPLSTWNIKWLWSRSKSENGFVLLWYHGRPTKRSRCRALVVIAAVPT
ncbi:hypothetical protein B0H10DRAFT_1079508 [Mycena sp. CBHHK59/15]|nr:hypothetical protein B0H10DRAFT_1079508 [Mycena sp. CBHHK59/15]